MSGRRMKPVALIAAAALTALAVRVWRENNAADPDPEGEL